MKNNENVNILWKYEWKLFWWKADNLNILYNKWLNIPRSICLNKNVKEVELYELFNNYIYSDIYIVRSSANCEDGDKLSYAWMFESIEGFISKKLLYNDVKEVFNSIDNEYLDLYEKNLIWNIFKNRKMNILIQEYIIWDFSGVYLSNMNSERVLWIIKWWNKLLVDWKVNWTNIYMDDTFKIKKQEYNIQEIIFWKDLKIVEYNKKVYVDKNMFLKLIKEFIKIEKIFWYNVDIEWTIKNEKIYILQVRPITTK